MPNKQNQFTNIEDNVTYMFILKCALKLVLKNILYYDARSEKHQNIKLRLVCQALVSTTTATYFETLQNDAQETQSYIFNVAVSKTSISSSQCPQCKSVVNIYSTDLHLNLYINCHYVTASRTIPNGSLKILLK